MYVLEAKRHELLVLRVTVRQQQIPVEDKGYNTEYDDKGYHTDTYIELVSKYLYDGKLVTELHAKTKYNFEHWKKYDHYKHSSKHERINFVDFLLFLWKML